MKIHNFEEIHSWQKARVLCNQVYGAFNENKDYGFKDQIQRASVSVMNNIAEGFERRGNKDLKHFLYIAKGSCGEVRSMLYLAKDLNKISQKDFNECYSLSLEISRMLYGFIRGMEQATTETRALNFQLAT